MKGAGATGGGGEPPASAIRSDVLRFWHVGDRDAAEAILAGRAQFGEWRLMLAAARFARAFESDPAAPPPVVPAREWPIFVNAVINFGAIAAARAALAGRPPEERSPGGAVDIGALLLRAPPTPEGQAEQEFGDHPEADVQVVRREGARTVVFAFTGGAHRFGAPLRLVHQWFRRLDAHVVYLRDLDGMFYAAGIRSIGATAQEAAAHLAGVARDLGADRVVCTGNSAGSFGAMRYGLELGAAGVLCFAGPSRIDESMQRVLDRQSRLRPSAGRIAAAEFDLAGLYAAAVARPAIRFLFSGENAADRAEAGNMAGIPGVELVPFPGADQHGVLALLVEAGRLEEHLAWLVSARPVSGTVVLPSKPWWQRVFGRR